MLRLSWLADQNLSACEKADAVIKADNDASRINFLMVFKFLLEKMFIYSAQKNLIWEICFSRIKGMT